jgi:hypothetical protein
MYFCMAQLKQGNKGIFQERHNHHHRPSVRKCINASNIQSHAFYSSPRHLNLNSEERQSLVQFWADMLKGLHITVKACMVEL